MAATQTYADFDVHICAVLEQDALTPKTLNAPPNRWCR